MGENKRIFLTFDLEEWPVNCGYKHDETFDKSVKFSKEGCLKLIDLFDKYKIQCTFFVTGYFANLEPRIIRFLSDKGHEICSHSMDNVILTNLPADKSSMIIKTSRDLLNDITGKKINGFRAPYCCLNVEILRILEVLNFRYDSSIHPAIVPGRYYNCSLPLSPYVINSGDRDRVSNLLEIPISVIPYVRFPISWWWMRNFGVWLTIFGSWVNLWQDRDVVLYFHPWEFTELPKIKGLPYHLVRRCGPKHLHRLERLINKFIKNHKFGILKDVINFRRT